MIASCKTLHKKTYQVGENLTALYQHWQYLIHKKVPIADSAELPTFSGKSMEILSDHCRILNLILLSVKKKQLKSFLSSAVETVEIFLQEAKWGHVTITMFWDKFVNTRLQIWISEFLLTII